MGEGFGHRVEVIFRPARAAYSSPGQSEAAPLVNENDPINPSAVIGFSTRKPHFGRNGIRL